MEYTLDSIVSLISHIHTSSADFTNKRLSGTTDECSLVSSHGFILYLLSKNGEMTMKDISERINRDKSTTTVLIRKLKEHGLIEEKRSENDSRVKHISLTSEGRAFNEATQHISDELLSVCYKGFSRGEQETLLGLLK